MGRWKSKKWRTRHFSGARKWRCHLGHELISLHPSVGRTDARSLKLKDRYPGTRPACPGTNGPVITPTGVCSRKWDPVLGAILPVWERKGEVNLRWLRGPVCEGVLQEQRPSSRVAQGTRCVGSPDDGRNPREPDRGEQIGGISPQFHGALPSAIHFPLREASHENRAGVSVLNNSRPWVPSRHACCWRRTTQIKPDSTIRCTHRTNWS